MRILMLGWEFPPFIAGGLGTACFGLTRALSRQGHDILFVLPRAVGDATSSHVRLLGPETLRRVVEQTRIAAASAPDAEDPGAAGETDDDSPGGRSSGARLIRVPAPFMSPYPGFGASGGDLEKIMKGMARLEGLGALETLRAVGGLAGLRGHTAKALAAAMQEILDTVEPNGGGDGHHYGADLFGDAERYAGMVCALGLSEQYDVIHAHDWLTYPAGMALRSLTGKPLVAHMHATEFDRSGSHINQRVYDIERAGLHGADRVIAVSLLTKNVLVHRYGVDPDRIDVVYNGVDQDSVQPAAGAKIERDDKIVLFLGRITMQKGPEYFISAAKRVLEKVENVKFVVAGSGDMAVRMIDQAASMGIGHKVLFTGFLRGRDVERVFRMADCYVMPSVSEPFGIAPLEAMQNDVPVIISKQSGVSEVLTHALKVDFWDVDDIANKIVAVLKYPPLSQTLREHGSFELRRLTWDDAAAKCVRVYARTIAEKV